MKRRDACIAALLALALLYCSGGPGTGPGGSDAGILDGGGPGHEAATDWRWIPIDGSKCARGARAGIGISASDAGTDLFLYLQGGGACWNAGTCVPCWLQFGPLCDYGTVCLVDNAGGTKPTAVYVDWPNPFPADGGGAFPHELGLVSSSRVFDRADPENPFRSATYVFVPYCTGDLHAGAAERTYNFQQNLFDPIVQRTISFAGATNMDRYLAYLKAAYPGTRRIWLTGSSAGGYGAMLNAERVQGAFPGAEVHLLADSAPFLPTPHWTGWRDTWNLQLPPACADCDGGFPQVFDYLAAAEPERRLALLAYDRDRTISWFFYAAPGLGAFLTPPLDYYAAQLAALESDYDSHPNARYFVLPGESHVMFGGYGRVLADGGVTAPYASADGGTNLRAFVDAWASGDGGWASSR